MSYKPALALAALLVGCTDDVVVMEVDGQATFDVTLEPVQIEPVPEDQTEYRWEVIQAPADSEAPAPVGGAVATFRPDVRGYYVVERWITYGLSDRLTYRFVVHAEGTAPTAVARTSPNTTVGSTVLLDGSESGSLEGRELIYRWRLTERPRDSAAVISDSEAPAAHLTPDVPGDYHTELAVFDGELWSARPGRADLHAE